MIKRATLIWGTLAALSACAPADVEYCNGFGVAGTAEYGKCIDYYHTQQAAFRADRGVCEMEAEGTYPSSLYDTGGLARSYGGFGGFGPRSGYYGGGNIVHIPPNYAHNMQVDALRMRIIEPCMQARGWNSGADWQAGKHPVSAAPRKAKPAEKLPWAK